MNAAALRRRLERLEARRSASVPELPPTDAERVTGVLQIKYIQDCERFGQYHGPDDPPKPFDWDATLERVRRMSIERGDDPDRRY
jgi:hypothetical protein